MENKVIVKVENLKKVFKGVKGNEIVALDDVNLSINSGEFVALLGPNGAGKSTLIKILIGVMAYNKGNVEVMGVEPLNQRAEIISKLGIVFGQRTRMWWDLPVADSFDLTKRLYIDGYPRRTDKKLVEWEKFLIDSIGVQDLLERQVKKLSLGEKMRCELVNTLLYNPDLIFLDEPTIGLDVVSKQRIREALTILHKEGKTILLTSHDTGDIEKLCQKVVVINHGKVAVNLPMKKFMELNDDIEIRLKLKDKIMPDFKNKFKDCEFECRKISDYELEITAKRNHLNEVMKTAFSHFEIADVDFSSERVERILMEIYEHK